MTLAYILMATLAGGLLSVAVAAFLTVSLLVHTNWPSLVLEGFWAAIAATGLVKAARARKETP